MSSKLSTFICQNCGSETSQYFGRCLNCNSWNSIIEEIKSKRSKNQYIKNSKKSIPFNEISSKKISRFTSGFRDFDSELSIAGIIFNNVNSDRHKKLIKEVFENEEIKKNLIFFKSPIGKALIGKNNGEMITVNTPSGERNFEILEVEYI